MKSASFIPVMSTVWYVVASLEMRMMTGLRESTVFGGLISCVARDVYRATALAKKMKISEIKHLWRFECGMTRNMVHKW